MFTVSRRIDAADGSFAGVVVANIPVSQEQGLYEACSVGQGGAIALLSSDGLSVLRVSGGTSTSGTDIARSPLLQAIRAGNDAGRVRYSSEVDGVERLGSFFRVGGTPLFVVVAHATDEVLARWRAEGLRHFLVTLGAALLLSILLHSLSPGAGHLLSAARAAKALAGGALLLGTLGWWVWRPSKPAEPPGAEPGTPRWLAWPLIAALCLVIVEFASGVGGRAWWVPHDEKIIGMLRNMAASAGVLAGAWVGSNFLTENIRRYSSMIALFEAASHRLEENIVRTELADDGRREAARRQASENIQNILVAVGKEALAESTEWLISHRTKPLKPVNA